MFEEELMTHRTRRKARVAIAATAAVIAMPIAAPALAASPETDPAPLNGYRSVGYVMSDSPETRDFQIADIIRTGAIDDLTHINYAFGNVTSELVCDMIDGRDGVDVDKGDAYNDIMRLVSADDSVDGVADTADQALAGNFNQLRKLKAAYPNIKILISLGGWTWSDYFSEAAATAENREKLVSSCLDLYIDGNLPVIGAQGGDGAAAGIFDGIDIDWEWPVTGGETANATPEDKENFIALMAEFREELDARGTQNGEHYLLSAFAPVGGLNTQGGWRDARLFDSIDFLNVQGYDYHGGWVPNQTGHQGNLWPDGDNNWGLALAPELQAYVDAGARPDQLNAGLAAYGHGWYGVENGDAAWQEAEGYIGTKTYAELRELGEQFFDPELGAAWISIDESDPDAVDGRSEWWSLDTPASVTAKGEHIAAQGYGGAMWWDLSGDYENELGGALGAALTSGPTGPLTAPTLAGIDPIAVTVGDEVGASFEIRGSGPTDVAVTSGALPAGLELAASGTLSGVPTEPGTFAAEVTASNAFGASEPVILQIQVAEAPDSGAGGDDTGAGEDGAQPGELPGGDGPDNSGDVTDTGADPGAADEAYGDLPVTGADAFIALMVAAGLVVLGAGAITVAAARRRS